MRLHEANSYKDFVSDFVGSKKNNKKSSFRSVAQFLKVHTSQISQVFNGDRHLTLEQAIKLTDFLELQDVNRDLFMTMVLSEKAGSEDLRLYYQEKISKMKQQAGRISEAIPKTTPLSESEKATFYSAWYYSAVRQATALDKVLSREEICERLNLPASLVKTVLEFLVETGLCVKSDNQYRYGKASTHVENTSPFVWQHHKNWRIKGMSHFPCLTEAELMFTAPLSLSEKDFQQVKLILTDVIEKLYAIVPPSPGETLACLNIDWFKFLQD